LLCAQAGRCAPRSMTHVRRRERRGRLESESAAASYAAGVARWLMTAANEFEADMICQRLVADGIKPRVVPPTLTPMWADGGRDIYVEDADYARAKTIINPDESRAR